MKKNLDRRTTIEQGTFLQLVSLADAYRILELFVVEYHRRGESTTCSLMSDIGLVSGGTSADPAQLDDFLWCASRILGDRFDQGV
jgi:hypothetical protein